MLRLLPVRHEPEHPPGRHDDEVAASELGQAVPEPQAPAVAQPAAGETAPAESSETGEGVTSTDATKLDPNFAAFVRAEAINRKLQEMGLADSPAGSVRFLAVTEESMALRRVWPRGLAIGVKGLVLEVDPATGDILNAAPMRGTDASH